MLEAGNWTGGRSVTDPSPGRERTEIGRAGAVLTGPGHAAETGTVNADPIRGTRHRVRNAVTEIEMLRFFAVYITFG